MVATMHVFYDLEGADAAPVKQQDTDGYTPNLRFKTEDTDGHIIDADNPIPIPAAGSNWSYWKQVCLQCTVVPSTQVNNVKFYTDEVSDFGVGVDLFIGDQFPIRNSGATTGYDLATGVVGTSGHDMLDAVNGHGDVTTETDAFTILAANKKDITISEGDTVINGVGDSTNYMVFQIEVLSTASPGTLTTKTFKLQYDEI